MKAIERQAFKSILEYGYVLIGAACVAIAFNVFLLPNQIASGGISGISTIIKYVFHVQPAFVQWAFNIPLFIAGVVFLGKKFGLKTLVGTIFLPLVVYFTRNIEPVTHDPLLGALYGGLVVGLGLGIVFKGNASTGGVDLAAQIIHKFVGIPFGTCVAMIDGFIVLTAAFVFSLEQALYALIGLFVTSKTIDVVQVGFSRSKFALIITEKDVEVRDAIFKALDRGVTKVNGYGGYTDDARPILLCAVNQLQFTKLKQVVKSIDSKAFVIVMDASEILGEGFKKV